MIEIRQIGPTSLAVHDELEVFLQEASKYRLQRLFYTVENGLPAQYELIAGFVPAVNDASIYLSPEPMNLAVISESRARIEDAGKLMGSSVLEGRVEIAGNGTILDIFESRDNWSEVVRLESMNSASPTFFRYGGKTYIAHQSGKGYLLLEQKGEIMSPADITDLLVHSDLGI